MKPKGVLFSGLMVNAILADQKNQTRRIFKLPKWAHPNDRGEDIPLVVHEDTGCLVEVQPDYPVGSICYVKETHYRWGKWVKSGLTKKGNQAWRFKVIPYSGRGPGILWAADCPVVPSIKRTKVGWHKRPAIFMPKLPARLWLEVTAVWVDWLQSTTESDAVAEGVTLTRYVEGNPFSNGGGALAARFSGETNTPKQAYQQLWESINGKGSWSQNQFVWVFEFRRIERPKDL